MAQHLPFDRMQRVGDEIYRVIAQAVVADLSDPRLAGVAVTRVRMTKDLRTVYCSFHLAGSSEEQRRAALQGLNRSRGFLKRRIGKTLTLKFMPEIEFFYDETVDTEERIEELLKAVTRDT